MGKVNYSIRINAPKHRVWENLWSDAGYRKWTSVFSEGSYAESDWHEGSKIRFLSPGGNGMYGIIRHKSDHERMTFEHHGEIKEGIEEPKEWAGATEDYVLTERDNQTELRVEMDMNEEFVDYFNNIFPKALAIVKELSEQ